MPTPSRPFSDARQFRVQALDMIDSRSLRDWAGLYVTDGADRPIEMMGVWFCVVESLKSCSSPVSRSGPDVICRGGGGCCGCCSCGTRAPSASIPVVVSAKSSKPSARRAFSRFDTRGLAHDYQQLGQPIRTCKHVLAVLARCKAIRTTALAMLRLVGEIATDL
jgi:hypothetical protein